MILPPDWEQMTDDQIEDWLVDEQVCDRESAAAQVSILRSGEPVD